MKVQASMTKALNALCSVAAQPQVAARVVVCGDTLFLQGISAVLSNCEDISVVQVSHYRKDAAALISALNPTVVIVEIEVLSKGFVFELLCQGFAVMGMDANTSAVRVLSGRRVSLANITELEQVIETKGVSLFTARTHCKVLL